jgi:hypothetical protein
MQKVFPERTFEHKLGAGRKKTSIFQEGWGGLRFQAV